MTIALWAVSPSGARRDCRSPGARHLTRTCSLPTPGVQASARAPSPSSRDSLPYYQANRLTWLDDGGTFTDSSEDEDEPPLQHAPPRRYPPSLYRNRFDVNHLEAAWDLLHRPRGVSVRAFTRAFRHLHDEPQNDLLELMHLDDRFVFFWPTPRQQSAFVRRLWPHSMPSSFPAMASSRPRLAMASFSARLACSASVEPVTLRSLMWPLGSFRQLPPASRRRRLRLAAWTSAPTPNAS